MFVSSLKNVFIAEAFLGHHQAEYLRRTIMGVLYLNSHPDVDAAAAGAESLSKADLEK